MNEEAKGVKSGDPVTVVYNGVVMHTSVDTPGPSKFNWRLNEGALIDANLADEGKTWMRGHVHSLDDGAQDLLKQAMTPAAAPTTK